MNKRRKGTSRISAIPACVAFFIMMSAAFAFAANLKKFTLRDGSVIQAEILSFANGVYRLRSDALGRFSLAEDKIQSIQFADGKNPIASEIPNLSANSLLNGAGVNPAQLEQMKKQMLSDPETVKLLEELQKNPTLQNILGDKDLMRAVDQGDIGKLATDPKIQSLINNKNVGKILERAK